MHSLHGIEASVVASSLASIVSITLISAQLPNKYPTTHSTLQRRIIRSNCTAFSRNTTAAQNPIGHQSSTTGQGQLTAMGRRRCNNARRQLHPPEIAVEQRVTPSPSNLSATHPDQQPPTMNAAQALSKVPTSSSVTSAMNRDLGLFPRTTDLHHVASTPATSLHLLFKATG